MNSAKGTRTWPSNVDASKVSIEILHRNHFKSKLQRMSVIARVNAGTGKTKPWALVKGSPEAIAALLKDGEKPSWYNESYLAMARDGLRVSVECATSSTWTGLVRLMAFLELARSLHLRTENWTRVCMKANCRSCPVKLWNVISALRASWPLPA